MSNLATTVGSKASQSDLATLQSTVAGHTTAINAKAAATDLTSLTTTVGTKANQSDLSALTTTVGTKATQSDLVALQTTVAGKALATDLTTLQATVTGHTTALAAKAANSDLLTLQSTVNGLYVPTSASFDTAIANRGLTVGAMQLKAREILNRIRNAQPTKVCATPITPVEAAFSGALYAVANVGNTSKTLRALGGNINKSEGSGAYLAVSVTSGYGYPAIRRGWALDTTFDGTSLIVVQAVPAGSSQNHRLMVNGQWVNTADVVPSGTQGSRGFTYDVSQFGAAGVPKRITCFFDENASPLGFSSSSAVDKWWTGLEKDIQPLSCAAFGDSYFDSQGSGTIVSGLTGALREAMGLYFAPMGCGGQGWVNKASNDTQVTHLDRINAGDLNLGLNKDLLILSGSLNDGSSPAASITANVTAGLNLARTQNPSAIIVMTSMFRTSGNAPTAAINAAVKAGWMNSSLASDPWALFIDTYAADGGTGWQVTSGAASQASRYENSSDVPHLTAVGYTYLAKRIAGEVEAWLQTKAGF